MVMEDAATVVAVAVALGTDAFSVALGFGIARVVAGFRARFVGMVTLLHILMPLLGLEIGLTVGKVLGVWAGRLGAVVLIYVSYDMIKKGMKGQKEYSWQEKALGGKETGATGVSLAATAVLGLSVSMDALTVGFGLGTAKVPIGVTVAVMGITAGLMTAAGFWGGRWLGKTVGKIAQTLGGCVLLLIALKMVL